MRHRLALLAALVLPPRLAAQAPAGDPRCAELRKAESAAWQAWVEVVNSSPTALLRHQLATLRSEARERAEAFKVLSAVSFLDADMSASVAVMRDFAARAALPANVRDLIGAERAEEFWHRAALEIERRNAEAWELRDPPEVTQRRDLAFEKADDLSLQVKETGCASVAPFSPGSATQPTDEGPLPVARHPAGPDPNFSEAPIITSDLITRWLRAYQAMQQGESAHWRAGRMTQIDYLAVTDRIRTFSSYACTNVGTADQATMACRTDAARLPLSRYFVVEEVAAFSARQEEVGNALSGRRR